MPQQHSPIVLVVSSWWESVRETQSCRERPAAIVLPTRSWFSLSWRFGMRFIGGFHTMLPAPFLLPSCIADRRTQIEWQKRQRGRVTSVELFQLGGRPVPSRIRTLTDYYLARPRDPEASIIIEYIRYIHRLHLTTLIEQKGLSTMVIHYFHKSFRHQSKRSWGGLKIIDNSRKNYSCVNLTLPKFSNYFLSQWLIIIEDENRCWNLVHL